MDRLDNLSRGVKVMSNAHGIPLCVFEVTGGEAIRRPLKSVQYKFSLGADSTLMDVDVSDHFVLCPPYNKPVEGGAATAPGPHETGIRTSGGKGAPGSPYLIQTTVQVSARIGRDLPNNL